MTYIEAGDLLLKSKFASWWQEPEESFVDAFDRKNNSIGCMRFVLASLVILAHSYPLGGYGIKILRRVSEGQADFGEMDVLGFFILSGYLIATSYVHAKSLPRYLWHRIIRIMPGYWVSLLVVAFVFAPIFYININGSLSGFDILSAGGPLDYVTNNFFLQVNQYFVKDI